MERAKLRIGIRVIIQIDVGEGNIMVVSPSRKAALGRGLGDELSWLQVTQLAGASKRWN